MQLLLDAARQSRQFKTPFLFIDLSRIQSNYLRLKKALPDSIVCFAVKSNSDHRVIEILNQSGSSFDVASWAEINLCLKNSVPPARLLFSAPVKICEEIRKAAKAGLEYYVFDSFEELEKIAENAPKSKVILRIYVKSTDSMCPMFTRFGAMSHDAPALLLKAKQLGLIPVGLTFHVGSQCLDPQSWQTALDISQKVWEKALKNHIQLELIDLGGGLPVPYDEPVPSIENILSSVGSRLSTSFPGLQTRLIEPGRYMTDQASIMVATVIGLATRGQTQWVHLDIGGFNGLFEIMEDFEYAIQTDHPERPLRRYSVCGPTCDGLDVIRKEIQLPEVKPGERVYIMNAGAYSISLQQYNGFAWAGSEILDPDSISQQIK